MNKILLMFAALTFGITTNQAHNMKAQPLHKATAAKQTMVNNSLGEVINTNPFKATTNANKAQRRVDAAGTVLMYSYPDGALFYGLTDDSYSYKSLYALTGAFDDVTFTNYSYYLDAEGKSIKDEKGYTVRATDITWSWGTNSSTGEEIHPMKEETDERGSMVAQGFGFYRFPTISYGSDSYAYQTVDEEDAQGNPISYNDCYWECGTEGIAYYTFGNSDGTTTDYQGSIGNASPALGFYSGFGANYGFISNATFYSLEDYATTQTWTDTGKKLVGFVEHYSKPLGTVFATSVVAWFWTSNVSADAPFNGKELTATIYTFDEAGNKVKFASAIAKEKDAHTVGSGLYNVEFVFQDVDPIFGTVEAPITLPNEEFIVELTGFDQLTGTFKAPFADADGFAGHAYALLEDGSMNTIGYSNNPSLPQVNLFIGFRAALPVAHYDEGNMSKVIFDVEGGLGAGMYDAEDDQYYGFVIVETLSTKDNWTVVEKPSWINTIEFDDQYVNDRGYMAVSFTADALTDESVVREGNVVLELFGKQLSIPMIQGKDVSGINTIKANKVFNSNAPVYNLAGQRVNNGFKGLVIRDGKKYVIK